MAGTLERPNVSARTERDDPDSFWNPSDYLVETNDSARFLLDLWGNRYLEGGEVNTECSQSARSSVHAVPTDAVEDQPKDSLASNHEAITSRVHAPFCEHGPGSESTNDESQRAQFPRRDVPSQFPEFKSASESEPEDGVDLARLPTALSHDAAASEISVEVEGASAASDLPTFDQSTYSPDQPPLSFSSPEGLRRDQQSAATGNVCYATEHAIKLSLSGTASDSADESSYFVDPINLGGVSQFIVTSALEPIDPLASNIEVFGFDANARQDLWGDQADDEELRTARQRAALVAAALPFTKEHDRRAAMSWLVELFQERSSPQTFQAISRCVDDGLEPETLQTMIALRSMWEDRIEWWVRRRKGVLVHDPRGAQFLTWRLAWLICDLRSDYDVEDMIADEWLEKWRSLERNELGYLSFVEYVRERVLTLKSRNLNAGLEAIANERDPEELTDSFGWPMRVPDVPGVNAFLRQGPRSHYDYHLLQLVECKDEAGRSVKTTTNEPEQEQ